MPQWDPTKWRNKKEWLMYEMADKDEEEEMYNPASFAGAKSRLDEARYLAIELRDSRIRLKDAIERYKRTGKRAVAQVTYYARPAYTEEGDDESGWTTKEVVIKTDKGLMDAEKILASISRSELSALKSIPMREREFERARRRQDKAVASFIGGIPARQRAAKKKGLASRVVRAMGG